MKRAPRKFGHFSGNAGRLRGLPRASEDDGAHGGDGTPGGVGDVAVGVGAVAVVERQAVQGGLRHSQVEYGGVPFPEMRGGCGASREPQRTMGPMAGMERPAASVMLQ